MNLAEQEQIRLLEKGIEEELQKRLDEAFKKDKSHIERLSEN